MADMVKLEKNVPIPPRRGREAKYPWRQMKVGDSFVAPAAIRGCFYASAKRFGYKIRVAVEGKNNVRVWRTA